MVVFHGSLYLTSVPHEVSTLTAVTCCDDGHVIVDGSTAKKMALIEYGSLRKESKQSLTVVATWRDHFESQT